MFYDDTHESQGTSIENVQIDIVGGSVYRASHLTETDINITNLSIQTNQLNTDDTKEIFNFESADIVNIINITILYIYDASLYCEYYDTVSYPTIDAKCDCYKCISQILFINNMGTVNIDGIWLTRRYFMDTYNQHTIRHILTILCIMR